MMNITQPSIRWIFAVGILSLFLQITFWNPRAQASKNFGHHPKPIQNLISTFPSDSQASNSRMETPRSFQTLSQRLRFNGIYNLNTIGDFKGRKIKDRAQGTISTSTSFGFGLDYLLFEHDLFEIGPQLKVHAQSQFEFGKTLVGLNWRTPENSLNQSLFEHQQTINLWVHSLQIDFSLAPDLSLFFGGNVATPHIQKEFGFLAGKQGWHTGASVQLTKNILIDALWRSVNISGFIDDTKFEKLNFSGLLVRGTLRL